MTRTIRIWWRFHLENGFGEEDSSYSRKKDQRRRIMTINSNISSFQSNLRGADLIQVPNNLSRTLTSFVRCTYNSSLFHPLSESCCEFQSIWNNSWMTCDVWLNSISLLILSLSLASSTDIQEFYELTLLDDTKSIQQKTVETLQIASKWEQEATLKFAGESAALVSSQFSFNKYNDPSIKPPQQDMQCRPPCTALPQLLSYLSINQNQFFSLSLSNHLQLY